MKETHIVSNNKTLDIKVGPFTNQYYAGTVNYYVSSLGPEWQYLDSGYNLNLEIKN